jgi:hypothetical protein
MLDHSSLLEQALDCLEQCDFSGGRTAYRQAALLKTPSETVLENLALAEEGERLDYRCNLVEKYPDSLYVLLDYIKRLLDRRNSNVAVQRCGELLQRRVWSPGEVLRIRQLRMSAAAAGGAGMASVRSAFKEDFLFIWGCTKTTPSDRYLLTWLAESLICIYQPAMIGTLVDIRDALKEDRDIKYQCLFVCLINNKIDELKCSEFLQRRDEKETNE